MKKLVDAQLDFYKPLTNTTWTVETKVLPSLNVTSGEPTKVCRPKKGTKMISCGQTKPLTAFSLNKKNKDGHANICKVCVKAYQLRKAIFAANTSPHSDVQVASLHRGGLGLRWFFLVLLIVTVTMFLTGYLTEKADHRDWSTVHVPENQS